METMQVLNDGAGEEDFKQLSIRLKIANKETR